MSDTEYHGARFYKCALQVNPASYAEDYGKGCDHGEDEYNDSILRECQANNIEVVGLADHGRVDSSESLREKLTSNGIAVFPGFEIASSEKIHMVCLYPADTAGSDLNGYLAQLMGDNFSKLGGERTHPSSLSCKEIAGKILKEQKGFWYAAHMTGKNGLLKLSGSGDNYKHLWKEDDLIVAGQIPGTIDSLEGAQAADIGKYKSIIENINLDYKRERPIAIINAGDVYKPETLSKPSASCLIKMTEPNFDAFRSAFYDPESRIRLNHQMPEQPYSVIKSIRWSGGGFFRDGSVGLSKHLNAFIGGRGAGKSTLIESVRFVLGLPYRNEDSRGLDGILKANISDSKIVLSVVSKTQNGQMYAISRRYGEQPVVKNEQGDVSNLTPKDILPEIELLGQNEILQIERDERAKLMLLKRFLPDSNRHDDVIRDVKQKLMANREKLVKAHEELDRLGVTVRQEPKLKEQLGQFKRLGIQEKLQSVNLLEKEKRLRERIEEQFELVRAWLASFKEVFDVAFLNDSNIDELPNKALLLQARGILESLQQVMSASIRKASDGEREAHEKYEAIKESWNNASEKMRDGLNLAIAQLPEQAGKTGKQLGQEYTRIVQNLTSIEQQKKAHEQQAQMIETLNAERSQLLEIYRDASFNRFCDMKKTVRELNDGDLKGKVRISVLRFGNKKSLKFFMEGIHGIAKAGTNWIDEDSIEIDLLEWSKWIKEGHADAFVERYKNSGMRQSVADKLASLPDEKMLELEEIELEDTVSIGLNTAHDGGAENYVPLENLSTGQKCTAILNLLLLSRDDPLIIDQPEDNLDNAFIADRIVKDIRRFKTSRQFMFATHNANIPVFGDAELIAVLSSEKGAGKIAHKGAIDKPEIRTQAAEILEGGKAAFEMRKKKYGF